MRDLWTVAHLTLHEAMRRRILVAALIGGVAFVLLFGVGMHFIIRESTKGGHMSLLERRMMMTVLTLAGLYATNFLTILTSVLLPLDTLSGEIQSGVIQTLAAKPIRRRDIVLGKWLGYWLVMAGYLVVVAGGVLLMSRLQGHFTPPNIHIGLPLLLLEGTLLLTLSIAGGTKFSTVTNGIFAFALYGVAFLGNWVEQIATFANNGAARNVGTVASLIMPSESLWALAASNMQPPLLRDLGATPFSPLSVPSAAMVWYAVGYAVLVLVIGVRSFNKRAL
jgi:ABC-type transport system involved in multi-copper enzyme maturation permease subunit